MDVENAQILSTWTTGQNLIRRTNSRVYSCIVQMVMIKKGITDSRPNKAWVNTDVIHHRLAVSIIARVTLTAGIIMDVIT